MTNQVFFSLIKGNNIMDANEQFDIEFSAYLEKELKKRYGVSDTYNADEMLEIMDKFLDDDSNGWRRPS